MQVKGKKGVYQFLSIPYETKNRELKAEAETSELPSQFEVETHGDELRERTDSSSSSCTSSDYSSRNEDNLDETVINETMDLINDTRFFSEDFTARTTDQNTP